MIPEDRELLLSLRRQQADLQQMLERLNAQLGALEARSEVAAVPEVPPPLPQLPSEAPLPPLPHPAISPLPPIPSTSGSHALPPLPYAATPKPSFEFQFGRWLTRIGALFFVLSLVFFATWVDVAYHIHERIGPLGKLGLMGLVSVGVVILGQRLERKKAHVLFFGRTLMAAGLAGLYVTIYASYFYEPLNILDGHPLVAGLLLLLWSGYVLLLAEERKSQSLGVFAVALAYISTAVNPVGTFTMIADLFLAATAMVFLLRNGWTTLSIFSLVGTYLALFRRLVIDENGSLVLDTSRTLAFWPHAIYLIGAWLIFTTAVILTTAADFRGGKRLAFLSLNNGALATLLALTAYIAGDGASGIGSALLNTGIVFLITSRFAGFAEIDPVDVMGAYAAQGLALFTAGIIVIYTGITRGVVLLVETFFLGVAAAFAGDRILTVATYVSAFFATLFLIWEIAVNAHHPWVLGFGGALVMFINAWASRSEVRDSPVARTTIVLSTSCFCIMAIGLIYTALSTAMSDSMLPPALAFTALALTFVIYYFLIYELPPLAQILMLAAQFLVLFPAETGEDLPWWSTAWVAAITLLLVTWWSRQRTTRTGPWTILLTFIYALALADLAHLEVRPYLDAQGWIVGASLLSVAFLVYGALTRVWSVAAAGQVFLILALYHFFFPPQQDVFPWALWAAAVPVVVVFVTARAAHEWLRLFTEIPESWRKPLRLLAYGYKLVALAALVRWVFGVVPPQEQMAVFLFLGTLVLSTNVRHASPFGIRCSFVLSAMGAWLCLVFHGPPTYLNALAVLLFLAQVPLLRRDGPRLVSRLESWDLVLAATATGWYFVSEWTYQMKNHGDSSAASSGSLTVSWAAYALFLFLFGLLTRDGRLRACGLIILCTAILRVFCVDLWGLSNGYRFLTFVILSLVTLGIGYIILRRAGHAEK